MTKDKKTDEAKIKEASLGSLQKIAQSMKAAAKNDILARSKISKVFLKSVRENAQLMDLNEKLGKEYDALTREYPLRNSKSKYNKTKS